MRVVSQVHLPLPISAIWPRLSDPEKWPEWMEGVVSVEIESCDANGLATSWIERFRSPTTGAILGVRHRLVESIEGKELVWELVPQDPNFTGLRQTIRLETNGKGTKISYAVEILNPDLAPGLPLVDTQAVRIGIRKFISSSLSRLTSRLQQRAFP